jgi:hypothetical protein
MTCITDAAIKEMCCSQPLPKRCAPQAKKLLRNNSHPYVWQNPQAGKKGNENKRISKKTPNHSPQSFQHTPGRQEST